MNGFLVNLCGVIKFLITKMKRFHFQRLLDVMFFGQVKFILVPH